MINQVPVSACLICKNEEKTLENCLKSIRPYVKEIVIVDTGSTDGSPEIAKRYADKWELYTDCNDANGDIESFSQARNRSFELATYSTTLWCDGDDVLVGLENLEKYYEKFKDVKEPFFVQFPYEYAYDDKGKCTLRHYRERLFFHSNAFVWVNGVHEVRIPKDGKIFGCETQDDIIWQHKRQYVQKTIQPNRNLRILKAWYEKHGDVDARQLYYLGLEYGNVGDLANSKKMLNRYLELSGWDDEKYMALLRLMEYDLHEANYKAAIEHALEAVKIKEDWGEAYFILAKCHYFLANTGTDPEKNWNKCINFAKIGLSLPPTRTLLFVNPNERNIEIHRYLNVALGKLNRVEEALESVNSALRFDPENKELLLNKKIYQDAITRHQLIKSLNDMYFNNLINLETKERVVDVLNNVAESSPPPMVPALNRPEPASENKSIFKPYHRPAGYPRNVQEEDLPEAVITPHAQAWGIPETFVYDDLPLRMTDAQLQALVVAVWKEYMFHDELLSAISFLENAPNRVRHTNETEDILRKTKNMVAWINDPEEYDKGNSTLDSNGNMLSTDMTALTKELTGAAWARYVWMTDRMPDKEKSICDMACIDGQMTNRWGLKGYKNVAGIDCCTNSIKIANEKAAEFKTGARHILSYFDKAPELLKGEKFDTITCGDVYEHLLEPVKDLLVPARKLVKDDGRMLLTTPYGAWFRGKFLASAHPWLWANEGNHWLADKNRGHIIAPTVWSTAQHFREAGWWVKDCTFVSQWYKEVPDQGNVCVEAYASPPPGYENGKEIVFFLGNGMEEWTPHSVDITGIGGSELAAIHMSKRLAAKGHRVKVYSSCGKHGEGIYNGVEYYQTDKFHDIKCDILVVSRMASALGKEFNIKAKKKYLWVHDIFPKAFSEEVYNEVDKILALSAWHKNNILSIFPFVNPDKIIITQNGLDLTRFDVNEKRNPHKVVYSSSPDRGLPVLLQVWPQIRAAVPDAELHIFYGFEYWKKAADKNQLQLIDQIMNQMNALSSQGVNYHGRVNQTDLARHYKSAGVWAYSTWFSETSCISAMEAHAAGLAMVSSTIAALNETVADRGTLIPGDWLSPEYQKQFVKSVINALLFTKDEEREKLMSYAKEHFNWDKVASSWDIMFSEDLTKPKNKENVVYLNAYKPIVDR